MQISRPALSIFHNGYYILLPLSLNEGFRNFPSLSMGRRHFPCTDFWKGYLHLRSLLPHFSITPPPTAIHFHLYHITEISLAKHTIRHNLLEIFCSLASMAPCFPGVFMPLLSPQFTLPSLFLSPFLKCCLSPSIASLCAQYILPWQLHYCIHCKKFSYSDS